MAYIYSKLKLQGVNAEMISEFAKDKAWENNTTALHNQAYIFGEQFYRMTRLESSVDVAITDSPLLLSILYNKLYNKIPELDESFNTTVLNAFTKYDSLNYMISRDKPYNPKGRIQTEQESDAIVHILLDLLNEHDVKYQTIKGNEKEYNFVVKNVISKLSE